MAKKWFGFFLLILLPGIFWFIFLRDGRDEALDFPPPLSYDIYPQVWSQHSPAGESYEFKVNCGSDYEELETCFLWELEAVKVIAPDGTVYELEKDFNIQEYSGEVTRRWVLYGPENAGALPAAGTYTFQYVKDGETVHTQEVDYVPAAVAYPTSVKWRREGSDLSVTWDPPAGIDSGMNYKVIIWNEAGTPDVLVSQQLAWDARSAVLEDVPFVSGGKYSLNVAIYFDNGYAYSEYVIFNW